MRTEVEVLDLGINNLASLRRGLDQAGDVDIRIVASAEESRGAELMVLPGVGAFGAAMAELRSRKLEEVVLGHVQQGGYLLGICLGMQLLSSRSEESEGVDGLGLIAGEVKKLIPSSSGRVPHMGWAELKNQDHSGGEVFPWLQKPLDYYFVHSYALIPEDDGDVLVRAEFDGDLFVAGVLRNRVLGLQFHPEKSSGAGIGLLSDVLRWAHG